MIWTTPGWGSYYRKGNLLESQGDYLAAFEAYDLAVAAARRAGDKRLEALVLGIKVIGQNRVGDVAGAAASAETAWFWSRNWMKSPPTA